MSQTFTIGGSGQTFFVGEGTTVLKTRTVGSAYTDSHRGDFTVTNAFFESVGEDLSIYKGTDAGYTPYKVIATDSAGKKASGYIGAFGAPFLVCDPQTGVDYYTVDTDGVVVTGVVYQNGWIRR